MPSPANIPPSGGDTNSLLVQVLAAIDNFRDEFREELHQMRNKVDLMATKDDLKEFLPRETAEKMSQATTERMTSLSNRVERIDTQMGDMRDRQHERELADARESKTDRKELDTRFITTLFALTTLIASPLIYALINFLTHR